MPGDQRLASHCSNFVLSKAKVYAAMLLDDAALLHRSMSCDARLLKRCYAKAILVFAT